MGDILQLPPPHAFSERYQEFLEHYGDCGRCERKLDSRGRRRLCRKGMELAYAALNELPPGQGVLLSQLMAIEDAAE